MAFCTKCGQPLIEGQPHNCPYENPQPVRTGPTDMENNGSFASSIDTDKMKESYNSFKDKIAKAGGGSGAASDAGNEKGKLIVPDCICANEGEVPIKQYNVAQLRSRIIFSKADGRLQVTNKRIIFRAVGRSIFGRVQLHQEFKIDELAGVEFRNNQVFNFINLIVGLILGALCGSLGGLLASPLDDAAPVIASIFGIIAIAAWIFVAVIFAKTRAVKRFYLIRLLVMTFAMGLLSGSAVGGNNAEKLLGAMVGYSSGSSEFWTKFSVFVLSICYIIILINLFLYCFVPNLTIKIKTKGSFPGIDILREPQMGLFSILFGGRNEENSGFLEVAPWFDTALANKELGTMIDDIQTLGDAAIAKWKQ